MLWSLKPDIIPSFSFFLFFYSVLDTISKKFIRTQCSQVNRDQLRSSALYSTETITFAIWNNLNKMKHSPSSSLSRGTRDAKIPLLVIIWLVRESIQQLFSSILCKFRLQSLWRQKFQIMLKKKTHKEWWWKSFNDFSWNFRITSSVIS